MMPGTRVRLPLAPTKNAPGKIDLPEFGDLFGDDAVDFVSELKHIRCSMLHQIKRLSNLETAAQSLQRKSPSACIRVPSDVPAGPTHTGPTQTGLKVGLALAQTQSKLHIEEKFRQSHGGPASFGEPPRSPTTSQGLGATEAKMATLMADVERKMRQESDKKLDEQRSVWESLKCVAVYKQAVFESVMGFVVLVNCFTIGVSCDVGSASFWNVVDTAFATVFLIEIMLKLFMLGCRGFFFGQHRLWNFFELALVGLAWGEVILALASSSATESVNLLVLVRMFRLARVARLIRLMRLEIFSELVIMSKGATGGMRTLFWSSVLIFWPLYVAALILRETLGEIYSDQYFSTVPMAFFTMFRCVVASECSDGGGRPIFYHVLHDYGWGFVVLYMMLTIFVVFGLFNVIVAIYVDNVMAAAKSDEKRIKQQRLSDEEFFNQRMIDLITVLWDTNVQLRHEQGRETQRIQESILDQVAITLKKMENMEITPALFIKVLLDKRAKRIFQELDVSDEDQLNLFDMLDVDGSGTIDLPELYEGISKLRGPARRSDMIANHMLLRRVLQEVASDDGNNGFREAEFQEPDDNMPRRSTGFGAEDSHIRVTSASASSSDVERLAKVGA